MSKTLKARLAGYGGSISMRVFEVFFCLAYSKCSHISGHDLLCGQHFSLFLGFLSNCPAIVIY